MLLISNNEKSLLFTANSTCIRNLALAGFKAG